MSAKLRNINAPEKGYCEDKIVSVQYFIGGKIQVWVGSRMVREFTDRDEYRKWETEVMEVISLIERIA